MNTSEKPLYQPLVGYPINMIRPIILATILSVGSIAPIILPQAAMAQSVVLTRATVAAIRNQVRLVRRNQGARAARVSDVMTPGDAISTAANGRADLRFNDNSLARLGAQTVFRFNSGTRSVDITRGTALMLIQPGRGSTTIRTPNGAAGIRGSAIFCRHNPETDTTMFGALTNSGIEIFNKDGSQRIELKGGQMAVLVGGNIEQVYKIDLDLFLSTSSLAEGLDLTNPDGDDKMLNPVRSEVSEALERQSPLNAEMAIANPLFVRLPEFSEEFGNATTAVVDFNFHEFLARDRNQSNANITAIERDRDNIRSVLDNGSIQLLPGSNSTFNNSNPASSTLPNFNGVSGNVGGNMGNILNNRGVGGIFPGGSLNNTGGNSGNFPGGGATGGVFPGGGATGGNFPGGGATGGNFPGGGATGGNFPGGGATGGNFPGGGATGGVFPGQGNGNGGNFPGQGNGNGNGNGNRNNP
ncbi:MAG: FecR domain-containing protein [Jaaginema sp. PMC 1080.18]|nr:FecR domain-containing protein [Jaaginema sp. PMC 1080.18]